MDYESLYALQDKALARIGDAKTGFYLTGGTASSRAYLHHRYSEDLDLFVNDEERFDLWSDRIVSELATLSDSEIHVAVRDERFTRLFLREAGLTLKLELINDVPSRLGIPWNHPVLGRIDTAENILANKLSALVDRREPKDLADIWGFCTRLDLEIEDVIEGAQSKAAGLFPADLARRLLEAESADWSLIQWIEAPDERAYLRDLHRLGRELILPS